MAAAASPGTPSAPGTVRRRPWRRVLHPVIAVCVVQAALSMTLVWSNTAFGDEADYLMDRPPGMGALAARNVVAICLRRPDSLGLACHLSAAWRSCRQHRRPRRGQDPVARFHARRNDTAVLTASRLIGRTGGCSRHCSLGVDRTGTATGLRHI